MSAQLDDEELWESKNNPDFFKSAQNREKVWNTIDALKAELAKEIDEGEQAYAKVVDERDALKAELAEMENVAFENGIRQKNYRHHAQALAEALEQSKESVRMLCEYVEQTIPLNKAFPIAEISKFRLQRDKSLAAFNKLREGSK